MVITTQNAAYLVHHDTGGDDMTDVHEQVQEAFERLRNDRVDILEYRVGLADIARNLRDALGKCPCGDPIVCGKFANVIDDDEEDILILDVECSNEHSYRVVIDA
ncbi:hypothetical protein GII30_20540 [Gordonia amarae]|nr:hypothetical protein [Gordonia amarae]MCS3880838.1 hypothetical protein [Gordonia amarae]QHN32488.1 hypothetical protein GII32_20705 [Gordonia amarae]QHN41236.1 hypothetical protein GII30_20540 [Gordonia amarae]